MCPLILECGLISFPFIAPFQFRTILWVTQTISIQWNAFLTNPMFFMENVPVHLKEFKADALN